jgi:hypothetical protein
MKKFTVFALVCVFALGACLPTPASPNSAPTADVAGTVNSISNTAIAQTLTAQPSPTTAPVQNTSTPPIAEISTTSAPATDTGTPQPNLTTTPATATSGTLLPGITPTITQTGTPTVTVPSGSRTATPTLGVLTYGTLPPANNPYVGISLVNKSKRQAYISLQVVTDQGYTIIEHPVQGTVKIKIPTGSYTYVVWVGGRQLVGYFQVSKSDDLTITIYKDEIIIN